MLESDLNLSDGTHVHFRPIRVSDKPMMLAFLHAMSPDTVYHRFFELITDMDDAQLNRYVDIDHVGHEALVGEIQEQGHSSIIAVGRFAREEGTNHAEVALVVRDDLQHHGIGTHLLRELVRIGRDRGITRFTADVLTDNAAMLHLFRKYAPGAVDVKLNDGMYRVVFGLEPDTKGETDLKDTSEKRERL